METTLTSVSSRSRRDAVRRRFPELIAIERIADDLGSYGQVKVESIVQTRDLEFPIHSFTFGPEDPTKPTVVFVGGVHGLERIGTRVIVDYLKTFQELLYWDDLISMLLEHCRVVFYPMVNPAGIYHRSRCNPNGVDLMRNAPLDADEKPNVGLVGGHRISPRLPWFRGYSGRPMEQEARALCEFIERSTFQSEFALTLDFHSGFGTVDRLWFPYACSRRPFENYVEMFALKRKLDQALPNHVYKVEPQSHQYITHGDLWDHLYHRHREQNQPGVLIPLCLEMGSWVWVKKNPKQMFNPLGVFNPLVPHRTRRILRRHLPLIDFLMRATLSWKKWMQPPPEKRKGYAKKAMTMWYPDHAS